MSATMTRSSTVGTVLRVTTAIFGGFTPLVSTWLIQQTGNRAAPGIWMAFGGGCGLLATLLVYRPRAPRVAAA